MFSKCVEEPEPRAESPRPLVATWSLGLRHLLADPAGRAAFAAYLEKQFSRENLDFWLDCEQYRSLGGGPARAGVIWERYLADDAERCVNVDARSRGAARARLLEGPPELFDEAQEHVFRLMNLDSYRRFLDSEEHATCARAELMGQTNPYMPSAEAAPTKLKKSRSNAEEGRRWFVSRLRARESSAPRERERDDETAKKSPQQETQIDLERICHVSLLGQARTIQLVDDQSVRATIDKLLRKRAFSCSDYDVKVEGFREPLKNLDVPMSTLAKRAIVVEPRVSLRLQVADKRPLSVRSKPEKTLAEVISSALLYHKLKADEVKVFRGEEIVPTSTKLQDVQNESLTVQIINKTEEKIPETPQIHPATRSLSTTVQPCPTNQSEDSTNRSSVGGVSRANSTNQSEDSTNRSSICSRQAATLDEITNRVFDEVLSGKTQLPIQSVVNSAKSECCGSEPSSRGSGGAVVTRIRDGDSVRVACVTPDPSKSKSSSTNSSPDSKPIPAIRRYTKPQPAARTSLAKQTAPSVVQESNAGKQEPLPPPLPPKPKYPPTKPPNWGHKPEDMAMNRIVYFDQPTSSTV